MTLFELPETREAFVKQYILKEDLVKICVERNLPRTGSKADLIGYIGDFIEHKPIRPKPAKSRKCTVAQLSVDMVIDKNYANNEIHRAFFKKEIGGHFKYTVPFLRWMETHKGKSTYREAIDEWKRIFDQKKAGVKFEIDGECKYNQYTRDFFAQNKNLTREDCIRCWNFKKRQPGNHRYEDTDLRILREGNT